VLGLPIRNVFKGKSINEVLKEIEELKRRKLKEKAKQR